MPKREKKYFNLTGEENKKKGRKGGKRNQAERNLILTWKNNKGCFYKTDFHWQLRVDLPEDFSILSDVQDHREFLQQIERPGDILEQR